MRRQSDDTASINFTGLYTGEVWRRNSLAPAFLGSGGGPWLYRGLLPVEWLSRSLGGSNLRTILLQRHRIMDHLLERWIREGSESMESVVEQCFRPGEPIVVITEGLTSYFTLEDMLPFWARIAALGLSRGNHEKRGARGAPLFVHVTSL
ncbi:hypothetical protein [Vreelandella utahensis]|uniref:hypothetical protein n=1 Tax=Vreelandella halophila TaxID=86177 RepID=UPI0009848DEA|nr:hypothetical protein [Halomonas utahensis]